MEGSVCVSLRGDIRLSAFMSSTEASLLAVASEFGSNCSVFGTLGSLAGDTGLKQALSESVKAVTDAVNTARNAVMQALSGIAGLLEEGMILLYAALDGIQGAINTAFSVMNSAISGLRDLIANALNAVSTAGCSILSSALSGMPTNVKMMTPGYLAASAFEASGVRQNANKMLSQMIKSSGIGNVAGTIGGAAATLNGALGTTLGSITALNSYVCTPL